MALKRPGGGRNYASFRPKPLTEAQQQTPRTKPSGALPDAILAALMAHGPQTAAEMAALLPAFNPHTIRTTLGRMSRTRGISRIPVPRHEPVRWKIGPSDAQAGVVSEGDQWTPGPWLHPNRAESLGLVKPRRREEDMMPLDFSDPRRRAA